MTDSEYQVSSLIDFPLLYEQTLNLIEKSFHYKKLFHFDVDFALLLNRENLQNSLILLKKSNLEVVGHIGVMLRELCNSHSSTTVALIGGVSIHENYRGKGLLKFFLSKILKNYTPKASLFFLWSEHVELFKLFNFHLSIGQLETSNFSSNIESILLKNQYEKTLFKNLNEKDECSIKDLYQLNISQNYTTFLRDHYHWENIKKISSAHLFVRRNTKQKIVAYLFMSKGQDLQNIIHEVGYQPEFKMDVLSLLEKGNILLPESEKNVIGVPFEIKFMSFLRLGNASMFQSFIHGWTDKKIKIIFADIEKVHFKYQDKIFEESFASFTQYIFGPNPVIEFANIGKPIYISGLDSI